MANKIFRNNITQPYIHESMAIIDDGKRQLLYTNTHIEVHVIAALVGGNVVVVS